MDETREDDTCRRQARPRGRSAVAAWAQGSSLASLGLACAWPAPPVAAAVGALTRSATHRFYASSVPARGSLPVCSPSWPASPKLPQFRSVPSQGPSIAGSQQPDFLFHQQSKISLPPSLHPFLSSSSSSWAASHLLPLGQPQQPCTMDSPSSSSSMSLLQLPNRPPHCPSPTSTSPPPSPPLPATAVASAPRSPPQHCQVKRARLTPISDRKPSKGIPCSVQIDLKGGRPVDEEPRCGNSVEACNTEEASRMSTAVSPQTPNKADDGNGHLLDSKIIQSRYTEEELAAEPLLGVANWLNCAPSALRVPGDLTSPAPKYHSQRSGESEGPEKQPKDSPSGSAKLPERVTSADPTLYVWDLDETLIIFQTLRNGRYADLFRGSKDPTEACELGKRWESLILDICDEFFFYKQVEDYNEPCLLSLQSFDDAADLSHYNFDGDNLTVPVDAANKKKLAYRHRVVGDLYSKGLEKLLNQDQLTEWNNLYEATDIFTDGWLTAGKELLEACQSDNKKKFGNQQQLTGNPAESLNTVDCDPILKGKLCVSNYNILVTSGTLIPSLVKCLLFRLDKYFHHLNIYSSREVGKLQCFHWIRERVQRLPLRFCVIGDGVDECEASQDLSWPFLKIDIGPYAVHRIPTVTMDIVDYYMRTIYDPSIIPKQI